jgi:hypothetical protein
VYQIINRFEISYCVIVRPVQFAVVGGVFGQNAAADRGSLEAAHDVTIAVGAPNQT